MDDLETRILSMLTRVQTFCTAHKSAFPDDSFEWALVGELGGVIERIRALGKQQSTGTTSRKGGTAGKADLLDSIRRYLDRLNGMARAIAVHQPHFDDQFRVPKNGSAQAFLTAASAVAERAAEHKALFLRYRMPPDFLDRLNAAIAKAPTLTTTQQAGQAAQVTATAGLEAAIERGKEIVKELDPIMTNIYENDDAVLAAWGSARRVERGRDRRGAATAPVTAS